MTDVLSYKRLYEELEILNASAYDYIYNNDFEGFRGLLKDFIDSGIMEQEKFPIAREYYRYCNMPITLNGIWADKDLQELFDLFFYNYGGYSETLTDFKNKEKTELYMKLTSLNDFIKEYGYDDYESEVYGENPTTKSSRDTRRDAIVTYIKKYQNLYKTTAVFQHPDIKDIQEYQLSFALKIKDLVDFRSKFFLTYNFILFEEAETLNEKLEGLSLYEKVEYLSSKVKNVYENEQVTASNIRNYIKFENTNPILFSNYLEGKFVNRINWKNYYNPKKFKLPTNHFFYLELAFYLCLPSSNEIERFLNFHGYSIKSEFGYFGGLNINKKTYHVMFPELCSWIDAGIDYNLLNEMFGFQLEKKSVEK